MTDEPDQVCVHGVAWDVHCCGDGLPGRGCHRGFFPPEDCRCWERPITLTVRAWFRMQRAQLMRTPGFQMELIYLADAIAAGDPEARSYADWLITRAVYTYDQLERRTW